MKIGRALVAFELLTALYVGGLVYIDRQNHAVPPLAAFALYPLALLIGAASMVPGGIGTTEAAIVFLLHSHGATFDTSALAAIGMRLTTLWLAIALGLFAIPTLETLHRARPAPPNKTQPAVLR